MQLLESTGAEVFESGFLDGFYFDSETGELDFPGKEETQVRSSKWSRPHLLRFVRALVAHKQLQRMSQEVSRGEILCRTARICGHSVIRAMQCLCSLIDSFIIAWFVLALLGLLLIWSEAPSNRSGSWQWVGICSSPPRWLALTLQYAWPGLHSQQQQRLVLLT